MGGEYSIICADQGQLYQRRQFAPLCATEGILLHIIMCGEITALKKHALVAPIVFPPL